MKYFKVILLFLVLIIGTGLNATSLKDAIKQNLITVSIKSNGSYNGESVKMEIKNKSGKTISLQIPPGQFLMPEDSSMQRMMITQEMMLSLAPDATKNLTINAFCTQMHKRSPGENTLFAAGNMATGNLLEIAKVISKNKFYTYAAQNAIWCITDDNDLFSIYSEDSTENRILREFVHKATGQPLNDTYSKSSTTTNSTTIPTQTRPNQPRIEHQVRDTIRLPMREGGVLSMGFYDNDDKELLSFFKEKKKEPVNVTTFSYTLTYAALPAGRYYVKMVKHPDQVVYFKEVIVTED